MWLVGLLPGAGCGVCGCRPLLAVLLGRVVDSVTGQQGEDEVRRLGAEIRLAFNLTGLSYLTKLLVIHTYGEYIYSSTVLRYSFEVLVLYFFLHYSC